jgi:hypothetical protein
MAPADAAHPLAATRAWLEQAVIGLNLCPFAKAVQVKGLVRYVCSEARDPAALRADLRRELEQLAAAPIDEVETTLLVHPWVLRDFLDFNDFLDQADALLHELGLEGTLQVASFHPDYRFAGTEADDVTNATNRAPHPTLHLLREASIDRAVAAYPEADAIVDANLRTLRALGPAGWARLQASILRAAAQGVSDAGSPRAR